MVETAPKIWHAQLKFMTTDASRQMYAYEWAEEKCSKFFIQTMFEGGTPVFNKTFRGFFDLKNKKKIIKFFSKGRKLVFTKFDNEYTENAEDYMYFGATDLVTIGFSSEDNVAVEVNTTDVDFLKSCEKLMSKILTKRSKDNLGKAHVLSQGMDGLNTKEIGVVGVPLTLDNYSSSVREGLIAVVEDLKSQLPSGKLTIIEGPPGTGKTFLIRSLIAEVPSAFFVIVPPAMVGQLGDPSIIPVLLRLKSKDDEFTDEEMMESTKEDASGDANPIVIIVEDADDILVKREQGDMKTISTVLNLTSGILGDLLDIRIIATTNKSETEMDDALTRDGRMSYHLKVGHLTWDEACDVYKRLMNDPDAKYPGKMPDADGGVLLATVYKEAKRKGYRKDPEEKGKARSNVETKTKRKMGF